MTQKFQAEHFLDVAWKTGHLHYDHRVPVAETKDHVLPFSTQSFPEPAPKMRTAHGYGLRQATRVE